MAPLVQEDAACHGIGTRSQPVNPIRLTGWLHLLRKKPATPASPHTAPPTPTFPTATHRLIHSFWGKAPRRPACDKLRQAFVKRAFFALHKKRASRAKPRQA
ncbi:MAG TPA: hypothetical protein VL178_04910 [Pseudomonas sp.]|nr:hypothetical protein [Pseudomonas sp.]